MNTPLVSVIVPTYNREKYITLALDSILSQTFKDYEILVIDDGSTDNTKEALKSYMDKIHYIYQNNAGVSAARNAGIRIAKGEWLAFLDSDDEWNPTYLWRQTDRVKQIPEAVIHVTNSIMIENNGTHINTFDKVGLSSKFNKSTGLVIHMPIEFVIKHHITNLPCTIIKNNLIREIGMFDESFNIAEDTDLIARVALKGPLAVWNEPLAIIYRRDEDIENLSSCGFLKARDNLVKMTERILKHEKLSIRNKKILLQALAGHYRAIGNYMLLAGNKKLARDKFRCAIKHDKGIWNMFKYLSTFCPLRLSKAIIKKL